MPQIPLPSAATPGQQQARSIGTNNATATPDAFGAGAAEATYRSSMQAVSGYAEAARANASMWNTALGGIVKIAGEQIQKDWRLDADAKVNDLALDLERGDESLDVTGDGSALKSTMEQFDERAQQLVGEAASPYQADRLREGLQRLRFSRGGEIVAREAAALKQTREDNAGKLIDGAEVGVFRNPAALQGLRDQTLASIADSALTTMQKSKLSELANQRLHAIALEKHIVTGNLGAAQALLNQDSTVAALGGLESVRAQARINAAAKDARDRAVAAEFTRRVLDGSQPLDPQDPAQRKIVDKAFTATGGDRLLADSDPNVSMQLASMAKTNGVVPATAISLLNGMALNGDQDQKIYALQTIGMIEAARPGVFEVSGAHKRMRDDAQDFEFLTSGTNGLGLEPADAINRIEARRTPEFQAAAEARKEELTGARGLLRNRTESELAAAFDDSMWSDPAVGNPRDSAVLMQTYRKAFEEHFVRTGDDDMAVAAAQRDLRRMYNVTRLSGDGAPRIVRNPIEMRYPQVDGSHDWVKSQAVADIKASTGKDIDPKDIFFESTRSTDAALARGGITTGNAPPYAVYWLETGPDGQRQYQTIPGKLFQPRISEAQAQATAAVQAEITRAADLQQHPERELGFGMDAVAEALGLIPSPVAPGGDPAVAADRANAARDNQPVDPNKAANDAASDASIPLIDMFGFATGSGGASP